MGEKMTMEIGVKSSQSFKIFDNLKHEFLGPFKG